MKNLKTIGFVAVTLLFILSCSTRPSSEIEVDMNSVTNEITSLEAAYSKASTAKDTKAIMEYYADNAQSLAPNKEVLVGKEEISTYIAKEMSERNDGTTSVMKVLSIWASGNIAIETGTWTNKNSEGKIVSKGKYMSLFEKQSGKYVCIRDIWNSDIPLDANELAIAE